MRKDCFPWGMDSRGGPHYVWCGTLLRVVLSSILNPSDANMIVGHILIIPTPDVLKSRGALHHVCSVALSSVPGTGMAMLLT